MSFHRAGLPGTMFAQDPLDYRTLARHSNMDLADRLRPDDLRQAAAAWVLWRAATAPERLPRGGS